MITVGSVVTSAKPSMVKRVRNIVLPVIRVNAFVGGSKTRNDHRLGHHTFGVGEC